MQFTPQETKWIEKLRKDERRWPRIRWIVAAIAILSTINCSLFGYLLYIIVEARPDRLSSIEIFMLILIWTKCVMYFVFAVCSSSLTITKWHGDPTRALLLKLLDAQQK